MSRLREETFRSQWTRLEGKAQEILNRVDQTVLANVREFVNLDDAPDGRLKTGLIVSTSHDSAQNNWLEQLKETNGQANDIIIQLQASQAPNLQTALKNVIRIAIETRASKDEYGSFLASKKRLIPMPFDLELLQKYLEQENLGKIIISFQDVETFDTGVLSDLISTFASWKDRIPFVVLLGIATTIELFESRPSKSVIRLLKTTTFNFSSSSDQLYEIFCAIQCDPKSSLYFGPSTINALYELTQDQSVSASSLIQSLKYAYMTHFFANPLSIVSETKSLPHEDIKHLCEAIRNLPSFQTNCESLISQGKSRQETVRQLLDNDKFLLTKAQALFSSGVNSLRIINERIHHLVTLYQYIRPSPESSLQLHAQLLQAIPNIAESPTYEALIEKLSLTNSDALITLILTHPEILPKISGQTLTQLTTSISKLHTKHSTSAIRPIPPPSQSLFSPTKAVTSSAAQREYTKLLTDLISSLTSYFSSAALFTNPTDLPLNESFLINNRSPLLSTFTPRPRFAIERALASPADYLGCDCCTSSNSRTNGKSERDATSVLYSLVGEAGREINVKDLWDTFESIIDGEDAREGEVEFAATEPKQNAKGKSLGANTPNTTSNDKVKTKAKGKSKNKANSTTDITANDDETNIEKSKAQTSEQKTQHTLALFYTSLANLKMLGLVKSSSAIGAANSLATGSSAAGGAVEGVTGKRGRERGVDVIGRCWWGGL